MYFTLLTQLSIIMRCGALCRQATLSPPLPMEANQAALLLGSNTSQNIYPLPLVPQPAAAHLLRQPGYPMLGKDISTHSQQLEQTRRDAWSARELGIQLVHVQPTLLLLLVCFQTFRYANLMINRCQIGDGFTLASSKGPCNINAGIFSCAAGNTAGRFTVSLASTFFLLLLPNS